MRKNLRKNHLARKAVTCVEASSDNVYSNVFKLWSQEDHNRGSILYIVINREESLKSSFKEQIGWKCVTGVEAVV